MAIKIIKDTNPIMRQKSLPVDMPLSVEDKKLLDEMSDYLIKSQDEEYAEKNNIRAGMGLAAIQLGIPKRFFVISYKNEDGTFDEYNDIIGLKMKVLSTYEPWMKDEYTNLFNSI